MSVQSDDAPTPSETAPLPAESAPPDASGDLESLRAELTETRAKADEYLRLAQRSQADFVNYRRRVDEERAQLTREANISFLLRLLPILDDFERAVANAGPADLQSGWGQGVQLVERNLRGLLAADDVQRIDAEGAEFDPREHEAVGSQPSLDMAEGHVLHVTRHGYRKGDRVIRPAQVIVSARPPAEPAPA
jgi:molecular chaperone GrpE